MSPFNPAHYERLLEGLEVTERRFSDLERTRRIDAEFFGKRHVALAANLAERCCDTIASVAHISDGNHFAISDAFVDEGIPYYRGQDVVGQFFIEQAAPYYITPEAFNQRFMQRSHLQRGDVLLSIIGTVGETSLVKSNQDATCSCKLAILRPRSVSPEYLAVYLSCPIGRALSARWKRGAVQTGLLLEDMDQVPIARFSPRFEHLVSTATGTAYNHLQDARKAQTSAEQTLLQALGLTNWQPPEVQSYVRSSRDAFDAGRLDAEHYQEKYYAAKQALTHAGAQRFVPLGDLLLTLTNGHTPLHHDLSVGSVPFLCAEHVDDFEINFNSDKRILLQHHERELKSTRLRDGDILLTIKGRVGNAAMVEAAPGNVNINQDVALLRADTKLPIWYVLAFLNSTFGKLESQRLATGAINPFLGLGSVRKIEIPAFSRDVMDQIAAYTEASTNCAHKLSQHAVSLLDAAKRAVEIAIEDSESQALAFLEEATQP